MPASFSTISTLNWMEKLSEQYPLFNDIPLNEVVIPGSHDAGVSSPTTMSRPSPDITDARDFIIYETMRTALPLIRPWSVTQDYAVHEQLVAGVRYFDFRVAPMVHNSLRGGYTVCEDELYTIHGLYGQCMISIVSQLKEFLEKNVGELVILDFQHLYEMTSSSYQGLSKLILNDLGEWLIPSSYSLTLPIIEYIRNNKRVLVLIGKDHQRYADKIDPFLYFSPMLFWSRESALRSKWFETAELEVLKEKSDLEVISQQKIEKLWVLQEVLTPDIKAIIEGAIKEAIYSIDGAFSLKSLESKLLRILPGWVKGWVSPGMKLNIVMTDFVHWKLCKSIIGGNMVRISGER